MLMILVVPEPTLHLDTILVPATMASQLINSKARGVQNKHEVVGQDARHQVQY